MMNSRRVHETLHYLTAGGGPLDFGRQPTRLLIKLQRELAKGRPISSERVGQFSIELGLDFAQLVDLLGRVTERDSQGAVTGALGLSLNGHHHKVTVGGRRLSAWCAQDTLFLPALLDQTADIESSSPVYGHPVRLRVSPERIEEATPAGAVVSLVVIDPDHIEMTSAESIWNAFCKHIHFFTSESEAGKWAAGRDDIEIVPVAESFELGRLITARLLEQWT